MGNIPGCCDAHTQLNNIGEDKIISDDNKGAVLEKSESSSSIRNKNSSSEGKAFRQFPEPSKKITHLVQQYRTKGNQIYNKSYSKTETNNKHKIIQFKLENYMAIYEGEIHSNLAEGKGRISFSEGQYFQGIFKKGAPVSGIFVFSDEKSFYQGDIKNYQATGKGNFQNTQSGYHYEGGWDRNLQHGTGTQKYPNGDQYIGSFNHGNKFGHGIYTFKDGSVYQGDYFNGYSDGIGHLKMSKGQSYQGQWKLGKMDGKGIYKWKNGEKYEGQYINGLREGNGTYYYENGGKYQGQWSQGLQHGSGKILQGFDDVKGRWAMGERVDDY